MGADIFLLMRDSAEQQLLEARMRWERLREWLEAAESFGDEHSPREVLDKMDELEAADV